MANFYWLAARNDAILDTKPLDQIQQLFEDIDATPTGMKFLVDCQ
ncbi:hypothetical protein [Saccharicrinis aurantiacus]|nr:hypothetical protein [Saccharicrinis aurantiacus]